jgi:hypothetical protein
MRKSVKIFAALAVLIAAQIINSTLFEEGCFDRVSVPNCRSYIAVWVEVASLVAAAILILSIFIKKRTQN